MSQFIVVMGVSGSGKTTVGQHLAERLGGIYLEGDDYHPQSNIDKMKSGIPLEDEDRWPWFDGMIEKSHELLNQSEFVIVACSALKASYREYLCRKFAEQWKLVFLDGTFNTIQERMRARDHFMPASLLESQFETLERPECETNLNCLVVSINDTVEEIVETAAKWILDKKNCY